MVLRVNYRGEWLTMAQLAKKVGLPIETLRSRHINGIRGEELWDRGPVKRGRPYRTPMPETVAFLSQFARLPVVKPDGA